MGTTLLAGCVSDPGPVAGERPALASVPMEVPTRYDAYERAVLLQSLANAAAATRAEAAVADARMTGAPPPVTEVATSAPIPNVPRRTASSGLAGTVVLQDDLVDADGVVDLSLAVQRDRRELERLTALLAAIEAPPEPEPRRVTVVAFAPGATDLDPFERQRLESAIAGAAPAPQWLVRVGGPLGGVRAITLVQTLESLGVPLADVATIDTGRDVDVAEIAVRR